MNTIYRAWSDSHERGFQDYPNSFLHARHDWHEMAVNKTTSCRRFPRNGLAFASGQFFKWAVQLFDFKRQSVFAITFHVSRRRPWAF